MRETSREDAWEIGEDAEAIDATYEVVEPVETAPAPVRVRPKRRGGLSGKLLILTIVFVMVSEILIYVPSIANFRNTWLRDAHATASVAAAILTEDQDVTPRLTTRLLESTNTLAIALRQGNRRRLLALDGPPARVDAHVDLETATVVGSVVAAFETLLAPPGRILRVTGMPPGYDEEVEVILAEGPLKAAMLAYSRNILILSLIISVLTATCVYFALRWLFVKPIKRLTRAFETFAEDPEDPARIVVPSGRRDELGEAEERLAVMQEQLADTIHQRRRLADLGLAVSKINHDLRNLLASAQLFSDRLASLPDPTVQRFVPKILKALDRAVAYTSSVMSYGKAGEAPPVRRMVYLFRLVDDVGETLGLTQHPTIDFENEVAGDLEIDADPDQLYRVVMNLCRNAAEAMENEDDTLVQRLRVSAERCGSVVSIEIADTGPGVPARVREQLFVPFQGSAREGGTGLGLAIAAELVRAHGGEINLLDTPTGATFQITIPDRPVDLSAARRSAVR